MGRCSNGFPRLCSCGEPVHGVLVCHFSLLVLPQQVGITSIDVSLRIGSFLTCTGCSRGLFGIPKVVTCNCWPGGIIAGVFTTATPTFVHVAPCMGVRTEFRLACTCCAESVRRKAFLHFACLVILDNEVRRFGITAVAVQIVHRSPYIFSVKPKWRTIVSGFSLWASWLKRICACRPLKDTLR